MTGTGLSGSPETSARAQAFAELNAAFLRYYEAAIAATLARTRPILIVNRPRLVLWRESGRQEAVVIPQRYDELKTAAHLSLAIFALLQQVTGVFDETVRSALARLRDLADNALRASHAEGGTVDSSTDALLRSGIAYLEALLKSGRSEPGQLISFVQGLEPTIQQAIASAVRLEIDAYHAQMTEWRSQMTQEEWQRMWVVVVEAPQARERDLGVMYFAKLLGEPPEGGRVLFAESLYLTENEQWALDHVAKQRLDALVSEAFFKDAKRLDRDVLGDAAKAYLDALKL